MLSDSATFITLSDCNSRSDMGERVGIIVARMYGKVAESLHVLVLVHHDHGDGGVAVQHVEHEIQVGIAVGIAECAHGLGPRLHLLVLLCREIADEKMRHEQRCDSYYHGCHNEQNLNTAYLVCPLHTDMITRLRAVYCLERLRRGLWRKTYLQFFLTLF